ncbi:SDR family NAD(P)-dependent oxidoreductase [Saccharopolyspora sp. WRP15-2]|uniref:SDR family NAD(P)-dependent oxidoreductase n=1 Tax=Saccharopolyspora oryzae TaxID=2997343 RepID=A0ABT4V5C8_9PSEU|nr:SDR family NAD(P)-dependent oxidoreductase [Saccharopolyspora oryzae]MDA3629144.1 SDR family NAD(P)-dependent oxidoreductase [Saccharopolyspora oryzae]
MITARVQRFVWAGGPAPNGPAPDLSGRRVAVIGGATGAAEAVTGVLVDRGALPWQLGDSGTPDAVVDLTFAEPFAPDSPDAAEGALLRTLAVLRACYPDWSEETDARRLAYLAVTYLDGRSGYGDGPIHQPLGGIWAGLAKTLHREIPNINARVVDVGRPDVAGLPDIAAAELYATGPAEIGHRDGIRHALTPRAQAVGEPSVPLGDGDVVLVCGGWSGIGFELARTLARRGCRVVVTGRTRPPTGSEEWALLDDAEFDDYRRDLMRRAAADGTVRDTRERIDRLRRRRTLQKNLSAAEGEGLPLRFAHCDITAPDAVADLIAGIPDLTGVVYFAGVDRPARLPAKSDRDFLAGVAIKVTGFLRVFTAVRDRELKFFCNSGSLTGRLGGMVGELDYAAGNEALARLGLWARRVSGLDVQTLCWPLWQSLSASSNVDAAVKYMPAMDPADGLGRWCDELAAPHSGEVAFLGPVDTGISVAQAGQFPAERSLPGFAEVHPRVFHLGDPVEWRPGKRLVSEVRFRAEDTPVTGDVLVGGDPALPITLLLDNALRSAEWFAGPVRELVDVEVDLPGLRLSDGEIQLLRTTSAESDGSLRVVFRTGAGAQIAAMTGRCREPDDTAPQVPGSDGEPLGVAASTVHWRGLVVPLARWRQHPCGTRTASLAPCADADLWAAEPPPTSLLPTTALENVLRMALSGTSTDRLLIGRITIGGDPQRADLLVAEPAGKTWYAVDRGTRQVALAVRGPGADGT